MSQGDLLADRKRLKRGLSTWRLLAILALFGALATLAQVYTGDGPRGKTAALGRGYIAQITIEGVMTDDPERDALLQEIAEDGNAKALLVRLNSPGGTTVGGEELYLQLRHVAKKKPVIGIMRTVCASACYMASLGTDHVIARDGTLTGSIGVLLQSAEISELAKKIGVTPITIKSGKYKDSPSFTEPMDEDERAVASELVMDAYDHFVGMIVQRRGLSKARVLELADGRVYTGRQAVPLKLIDGTGGEPEAREWLASKEIDPKLTIREMDKKPKFDTLLSKLSQWTGIKIFNQMTVGLDGLISIWQHPSM